MASTEAFTFVESTKDLSKEGFGDYVDILSAKVADVDIQFSSRLRAEFPELIVTTAIASNIDLLLFANLGYASYELDTKNDSISRWRGFIPPGPRGEEGFLGEIINYARYKYKFGEEYFILFRVKFGYTVLQYILKEPHGDAENQNTVSSVTDALLKAAGAVLYKQQPGIFVFDNYWYKDRKLYEEVQKSTWDKVILDPAMKEDLTDVSKKFFDSKQIYEDLGVAWKRGIMFHGPAGNGKTISIKALMHTLSHRNPAIPTLYVKSAPDTYYIRSVFQFARRMSPCLLVLEDIETIVTARTRSYFFNEVDGLENNDGILMVASTNYLNRLDPGLTKRPSRFDRKYLFPLPDEHERKLYAEFWHEKLKNNSNVDFPKKLCAPIAKVTYDFSFAYIQEAFVATLLDLARRRTDNLVDIVEVLRLEDGGKDEFDHNIFWRAFKKSVKILRDDMDSGDHESIVPSLSVEASQVMHSLQTSMPALPGTYRDENPASLSTSRIAFGSDHDKEREQEGLNFMARFDKREFVNPGASEFRPYDQGLVWARNP